MPTIDLTPDQVKQAADAARVEPQPGSRSRTTSSSCSRSRRSRTPASRRWSISRRRTCWSPPTSARAQLWVSPEPGAGLIRDQPELIAVDRALRLSRPGRRPGLRARRRRQPDPRPRRRQDTRMRTTEARRKTEAAAAAARARKKMERGEEEGGGEEEARDRGQAEDRPALAGGGRCEEGGSRGRGRRRPRSR